MNEDIVPSIERITREGRTALFELSNGIVLRFRTVPPLLLSALQDRQKLPAVPVIETPEGRREDYEDADFKRDLLKAYTDQDEVYNKVLLAAGSEFVSVPEGYFGPDDDSWIKTVESLSGLSGNPITIEPELSKSDRYVAWLRYYAMETNSDVAVCNTLSQQLGNVKENELEEITSLFFTGKRSAPNRQQRRRRRK